MRTRNGRIAFTHDPLFAIRYSLFTIRHPMSRVVLAANAIPRDGGVGLNLAHLFAAISAEFETEVFCAAPFRAVRFHAVPPSWLARRIAALPGFRRLRCIQANLEETHFDRFVSRHLPRCDVFHGLTGQCARSLRAAKSQGTGALLDVVTVHHDEGDLRVRAEFAAMGLTFCPNTAQGTRRCLEYGEAERIRVMSRFAQKTFLQRGFSEDKVRIVSPPIELDQFPAADFRHSKFRVTFIGRLEFGKGFHHAVEAFQQARLPDSELILWGGSGSRKVAAYLRERVAPDPAIKVRPVPIRSAGLEEVFGKSHVLLHPSLADGFGYVVAEAMAAGVPVIATETTGASDWIVDGLNGFVVPAANRAALRERIAWCHAHADQLPLMGAAARETAAGNTLERFQNNYLPIVRALAGNRS
jgi:glycosyltransferase involved in cell wall biosynthesis